MTQTTPPRAPTLGRALPVSVILQTTSRLLVPIMLLFSLFVLLRGHHAPGGGFGGGLIAVAAFGLYAVCRGWRQAQQALRWSPEFLGAGGLAVMVVSGLLGLLAGRSFLGALWLDLHLPGLPQLEVGTPVLFDVGVYLAVLGSMLTVVFALMRRAHLLSE